MYILVLNGGSSSQKMCLYDLPEQIPSEPVDALWAAYADWTKKPDRVIITVSARGQTLIFEQSEVAPTEVITSMLQTLWQGETAAIDRPADIAMVGHRVVHGGTRYQHSVI